MTSVLLYKKGFSTIITYQLYVLHILNDSKSYTYMSTLITINGSKTFIDFEHLNDLKSYTQISTSFVQSTKGTNTYARLRSTPSTGVSSTTFTVVLFLKRERGIIIDERKRRKGLGVEGRCAYVFGLFVDQTNEVISK